MDMAKDYDWLFPRGRFSRQAKILETQLLYSRQLSGKSQSAKLLQRALSSSSSPRTKNIHREFPSHSLMTVANREHVQLSAVEVLPSPKLGRLFSRPEDEDRLLLGKLRHDLEKQEREAYQVSQGLQKETLEGDRLRGENQELGWQLGHTLGRIGQLETRLGLQEKQLASREKTVTQLNQFLQETAEKQAKAREALKDHMEGLMQRAESAENEIATLKGSAYPVSRTLDNLQPAGSLGMLYSEENGRFSRSGHDEGKSHSRVHHGLHAPPPNADTSWRSTDQCSQPGRGWPSPRHLSPQESLTHSQSVPLHPAKKYPEFYVNPALSETDFDEDHPGTNFHADSGLGSSHTGHQLSVDQSAVPVIAMTQPRHPAAFTGMTSSRIPHEQTSRNLYPSTDKLQSSMSLSQSTNSHSICESQENLKVEPTIRPSVNSSLLQAFPAQQSSSSFPSPFKSDRPWDLNFLTEVMEDVLKNRDVQNQPMNNPSSAGHEQQRSQSNVGSPPNIRSHSPVQTYHSTPSPYRQNVSLPLVAGHWSSSDYDETDSEGVHISNSRQTERSNLRAPSAQHPYWRAVWLSVFAYLDTTALLTCAEVCREWRAVSKHPSLWRTVRLTNRKISSAFLQTISKWCKGLEHLYLEGLKPRSRAAGESREKYGKNTWGSLEPGLEYILISAGARLITLKIVDCSNILTERSLFLASCYCRNLYSLTYISQTNPIGHEVIWALGAGCRSIASLKVPPRQPCQHHQRLSNRCLQMIGRCWPLLLALSVGGPSIDIHGLVSVARNCPRLQVLELDHLSEVTEVIAIAMCQAGLRGLHTLILRNTLISPATVKQFNGACPQLNSLSVYLSPSVCGGNNKDFHNVVSRLRALTKKRVLSDVLHVYAKYN